MSSFPLIAHSQGGDCIAWRHGKTISAARFLADVAYVSALLPSGQHVLNACADRYHFMVGLAAALTTHRISLLPSTQTPETLRQLREFAPDAFRLTEVLDDACVLPQVLFPDLQENEAASLLEDDYRVPCIEGARLMAYVFTSGSTGAPVPHPKTWGGVVQNVQAEARLWQIEQGGYAVVGTVPPQHMYGFESTVLVVMQSGNALVAGHAFYPADICATLEEVPGPRVLVSTPVHLRALLQSGLALPAVDLLVSATAPLLLGLAQEAEAAFRAPLLEIYGSTETGQIAARRSTQTEAWTLFPGVQLYQEKDMTWVRGSHLAQAVVASDRIEILPEGRFLLHGRHTDMLNIAGKRNSLAYLNRQLEAIEGVEEGAFFMPDDTGCRAVTRLTAFVVAPGLSAAAVLSALRERIDPVFLPRPLHFVAALPRNATGKLPRSALAQLHASLASHAAEVRHE